MSKTQQHVTTGTLRQVAAFVFAPMFGSAMLPISMGNPLIVGEWLDFGFIAAAKLFGDLLLMTTPFYVIIAFFGVPVFLLTRRLALWDLKGCIVSAALVVLPEHLKGPGSIYS